MNDLLISIKNGLTPLFVVIITFLTPIFGLLLSVGIVILLDTLIAYFRCKKQGIKWTSKKMRVGLVPKFIGYQLSIITLFVIDKFLMNEIIMMIYPLQFLLTKILTMTIIYMEFMSMDENWKAIKGKSLTSYFFDMIKSGKKFKEKISSINDDKLKQDENNTQEQI